MLRFASAAAWAVASGSVLGCGSSHDVDYFASRANATSSAGSSSLASAGAAASSELVAGASGAAGSAGAMQAFAGASAGGSGSGGSNSSGGTASADHSSTAGASSTGVCTPAADIGSGMSFATLGPVCLRVTLDIAGWGCSNFEGRTVQVNGMTVQCAELPLPNKVDGAYYFDVSAGEHEYASLYWY